MTTNPTLLAELAERCGPKIVEWTAWLAKASQEEMRRELIRLYTANDEGVEGDLACKIMSYDWCHQDAEEMGFESLTEALEALAALRAHMKEGK